MLGGITTLQWMDIVYAYDTALCGAYLVAKVIYLIVRKRYPIVSPRAIGMIRLLMALDCTFLAEEMAILWMLSILTGEDPRFSIENYRIYMTWARSVMGFSLTLCTIVQIVLVWEVTHK